MRVDSDNGDDERLDDGNDIVMDASSVGNEGALCVTILWEPENGSLGISPQNLQV